MNIKSYTNESFQRGKSDSDKTKSKTLTTTTTTACDVTQNEEEVTARSAHIVLVVVEEEPKAEILYSQPEQSSRHGFQTNKDKVYVATANHLNIEAIEKASSMVAINSSDSDDCSNSNRSSSGNNWLSNGGCNKLKRQLGQRRISLNEYHNNNNKYGHNNDSSSSNSSSNNYYNKSNIDVQTFTNTKELNQLNLNSSSTTSSSQSATSLEAASTTTTATIQSSSSSSSTPLAILATATATEIARQQQQQQRQQQQLIMSPTALASCAASCSTSANTIATVTVSATVTATGTATTTVAAVHLRKSHSTPALKFVGYNSNSNIVDSNSNSISNKYCNKNHVESAMEASNIVLKDVAVVAHIKRQQQQQQHDQFPHETNTCSNNIDATQPTTPESLRFGCTHYKRRAMFVTPCCNKFYKCRFCHDENESHHFDRKTLTELICSECNTRQKVQEQCEKCGTRFGKYTCLICNLFDDADKQQYHCHGCGICRIGGAHNFFHCEVCNMCLPMQLKIDGHRCVENISRSHCPVCLGDIHTSRIPCHIPDCGHLLHKMCFDQLLASGHYTCPTCQTSLIDMTALWDYLDAQALRMPVPLKYENQRVHIFCNDCHKTSKTKFHFIGLKCVHCGAYNTTQDVKRRLSLVTDEPSTA